MTYERARILDCKCADRSCFGISSRHSSSAFLMLAALLALSCSLGPTPKQMYEGPPLPKEQVGIVRNWMCGGNRALDHGHAHRREERAGPLC